MRESDVFRQVAALRRRPDIASVTDLALEVHARVTTRARATERASFVTDADLDALVDPRAGTLAAVELCLAGLWRRADAGYAITDAEHLARVIADERRPWVWRRLTAVGRRVWAELTSERFIPG